MTKGKKHMSPADRATFEAGLRMGKSLKQMGRLLDRSTSTLARELKALQDEWDGELEIIGHGEYNGWKVRTDPTGVPGGMDAVRAAAKRGTWDKPAQTQAASNNSMLVLGAMQPVKKMAKAAWRPCTTPSPPRATWARPS